MIYQTDTLEKHICTIFFTAFESEILCMMSKLQVGQEELQKTQNETKSYVYKMYKGMTPITQVPQTAVKFDLPFENVDILEMQLDTPAVETAVVSHYIIRSITRATMCLLNIFKFDIWKFVIYFICYTILPYFYRCTD